ncbi:MAG TPA: hypothetical protein VFE58_19105 [Tepidisphaeraceae bacterium]|nr:hypothetical protein [Tepidisphaeraceae bacterium]
MSKLKFTGDASTVEEVPGDLDFILSALEAGATSAQMDKRQGFRIPYRAVGKLKLYSAQNGERVTVYTRDVCPRSLGFVSQEQLPLGYGGILELKGPDGREMRLDVTLLRCREAVPGWFEGALYFNRQQIDFSAEEIRRG